MAFSFVRTSSQYVGGAGTTVTASPLTMFAIINPASGIIGQAILAVSDTGDGLNRWVLAHSNVNLAEVAFQTLAADVSAIAQGARNSITTNVWQNVIGVEVASNNRAVYVDATIKATNTDSKTPIGVNEIYIGARNRSGVGSYHDGLISEATIWNAALTDAEIASLAKGFSPRRIRPQSLVFYAPLLRNLQDLRQGLALTAVNSPTVASHPRVY